MDVAILNFGLIVLFVLNLFLVYGTIKLRLEKSRRWLVTTHIIGSAKDNYETLVNKKYGITIKAISELDFLKKEGKILIENAKVELDKEKNTIC